MNGDFLDSLASVLVDVEGMPAGAPGDLVEGQPQKGSWLQDIYAFLQGLGSKDTERKGAKTRPPAKPETKPVGTIGVLTGSDWLQAAYDLTRQFLAARAASQQAEQLRGIAANPQYPPWLRQSWANEGSPGGLGKYGTPKDYGVPKKGK